MLTSLSWSLVAVLLTAEPISFKDALERAERRSPDLAVARLALPEAEAGIDAAGALPNPLFSFGVGPDEPTVFGSVEQRFPFLGQRQSAMAAAGAQVPVAKAQLALRDLQLKAEVRRAYFQLAAAQAQVRLAEETSRLDGELAQMAAKKFEAGSAPQLDVEQARLAQKRSEEDVEDRRAALDVARLHLATVLGEPPDASLETRDPLTPLPQVPPLADLLARAAQHPEVDSAEGEKQAALARAHKERMSIVPTPSLSVEVEHLGTNPGVGVRGGISLDVPILSQNSGAVNVERAQAERADARKVAALRRLEGAAREAHAKWLAALRRVRFAEQELIPAAVRVAALARVGYDVGRTPLFNLVQAQADVAAAQARAVDGAAEGWAALADLEEAVGAIP